MRSKNTGIEMVVRRLVHRLGYRYRLHSRHLPGEPDLVFPSRRQIIFVHGCFWHRHDCRKGQHEPRSRRDYWRHKLERNRQRDQTTAEELKKLGWCVLVVWECQTKHEGLLETRIRRFLDDGYSREDAFCRPVRTG